MMNLAISALLVVETIVLISMIIKLVKQKEVVDIKNTKYFLPTVVVNLGVYLIAVFGYGISVSNNVFLDFVECLSHAVSACFLSAEMEIIAPAMTQSVLFEIAFIFSFALNVFTLLFVLVGFMGRFFVNFLKVKFILWSRKEKFFILGYNADAKAFARTIPSKNVIFWVGDVDKAMKKELLSKKHLNIYFEKFNEKNLRKFKKSKVTVVSFETDNAKVLKIIEAYKNANLDLIKFFVAIDHNYDEAFKFNYGNENIFFFNKYSLICQKFLSDHPMTKFLNNEQIDYNTATVKNDVDLNVVMIGYGMPNKNLFYNLVIDNQLPTIVNGKPQLKKVNYHIYDKNEFIDKNYNSNFGRFIEADFKEEDYYPLPQMPMNMQYHQLDIFKNEFTDHFNQLVDSINHSNSLTYIVVSFGSDLDNIDQVIRLKRFFLQKGIEKNVKFFCRITRSTYVNILKESDIIPFGEYDIMDYDTIVCDNLNKLSIERTFQEALKDPEVVEAYEQINRISSIRKQKEELSKLKLNLWNRLDVYKREFDVFSSINIRTKLNLCGLDIVGLREVSNKEFYQKYDPLEELEIINREKIYKFPYSKTLSPRNMLAYQELLHSNAFWLIKGFVPMKKGDININNDLWAMNKTRKEFVSLTTFEGLDKIINECLKAREKLNLSVPLEELDLKKVLYQVMDNIPLFKYTSFMIYKKENDILVK